MVARAARAMNRLPAVVLAVAAAHSAWGGQSKLPRADVVLQSGAVYTMDGVRAWAQAVAIASGRILGVGTNEQMAAFIGPATWIVDLKGKMLMPAFQDV